jgi:hypothetical protein
MIESLLNRKGRKRVPSLLGLALEGGRLEGVVLKRTNGSLHVQQSLSVALSLHPLTAAPELVGREIRNHLDAAGIRERYCIFGLPLSWVLAAQVEMPEIPAADVASFLQIEAERNFPCDPATLQMAVARTAVTGGKSYAQLAGIPLTSLTLMEQALRAARLVPLSFSLGITALQPPDRAPSKGIMALSIGESQVSLQVTWNGGIVALRTLESALETETGRRVLNAPIVAREARVTLGQLPAEIRDQVRQVHVFGPPSLAQQLADELDLRLESSGLKVDVISRYAPGELGPQLEAQTPVSMPLSLAATYLAERKLPFEFLPPRQSRWQRFSSRYASGRLRTAGAVAALLALGFIGAFGYQQWTLMRLERQWTAMSAQVQDLEKTRDKIRQFRSWYDSSHRALRILRQLSTAFPEEGSVSAKSVEIKDLSTVTCSGSAQDSRSLYKTLDRLRAANSVADVQVNQIRGRAPTQFTFDFQWSEGGAD